MDSQHNNPKRWQFSLGKIWIAVSCCCIVLAVLSLSGYAWLVLPLALLLGTLAVNAMFDLRREQHPADRAVTIVYCVVVWLLLMLLIGGVRSLMHGV